jgi:DHA3 family macrolide efflux protein-like MFS transporter
MMNDSPKSLRAFFLIWTGQAFSLLGSSLVQFALVWWLTESTGSATVLATATMVAILPGIVIGPFAGTLVDRWSRRWVMVVADGVIALTTLWAVFLAWNGQLQTWHVYVIMFIRATAGGFHWPAMQASTSLMVPERLLSRVAGLNQTLYGLMQIAAPALGALLLSVSALPVILMIDVITAAMAITPLLFINVPQPPRQPQEEGAVAKPSVVADLVSGVRYVLKWPGLLMLMAMAMIVNFVVNPAFSLMPILVIRNFNGGVGHLGALESALGIGMVLGGLVLSAWGGFRRRLLTSLAGLIGMGLGVLVMGLAPPTAFVTAVGAIFLVGFMNPIVNGPVFAVMQATVAPEMQGRVFTLLQSAASAMSPLSLAVAGPVADTIGVQAWYIVGGLVCVLMGIGGFFVPALVHLEDNHHQLVAQPNNTAQTPISVEIADPG